MTTSYGPVREVMFSPVSNPTDVNSFLIRDDAYARSSAVLGRTLRLGDPIDTGVVSASRQTSWAGGRDQNHFDDVSMFQDSNLDTTDSSGAIRFWPSLEPVSRGGTERNVSILGSPLTNDYNANRILFTNDNGTILSYRPSNGVTTTLANFPGTSPTVTVTLDQTGGNSSEWVATGFTNGDVQIIQTSSGTIQSRSYNLSPGFDSTKIAAIRDMIIYKRKLMVMMGYRLWTADYSGTTPITWVENFSFNKGNGGVSKMAIVNGVLYVLVEENGGKCSLYNSDGVSGANLVHTFENCYPVNLLSLKGSLYIHVNETAFNTNGNAYRNGALYRYTGSGVDKLYSRSNNAQYFVDKSSLGPSCVWGDYIAVSFVSSPRVLNGIWSETVGDLIGDNTVGVVLYNPSNDSFHTGPTLTFTLPSGTFGTPIAVSISAMGESNGSLYIALHDGTNRVICGLRRDRRVTGNGWYAASSEIDANVGQQTRKIVSSAFDAGLPEQNKTWLRVNVKHNLNDYFKGDPYTSATPVTSPTMRVYVSTSTYDYNTNKTLIGTYVGTTTMAPNSSSSGWITSSFNIPAGIKSTQLKYIIELDWNVTWPNFVDIDSAVIDSVSVEYMLVASPKKVWRTRMLAEDSQLKLSGTANTLTTRSSLVNKLFDYWTNGVPLYYWDASPSTVTPTFTSGVPTNHTGIVMVTDIGENSYRVHDLGSEVNSEVSLTFYEVA